MSLIRAAYDTKAPDSHADHQAESEDGLSTCPDCGAKVDTVALKKRMAADQKEYAATDKDRSFWESTQLGLRNSPNIDMKKDSRRRADALMQSQLQTADRWTARRDTLAAERAKPTGRK